MKVRYWMTVYPYQMAGDAQHKPFVSSSPIAAPEGAKVLAFEVTVPDDLFGEVQTTAELLPGESAA